MDGLCWVPWFIQLRSVQPEEERGAPLPLNREELRFPLKAWRLQKFVLVRLPLEPCL